MNIPISPRTTALVLRYEGDPDPIPIAAAHDALAKGGGVERLADFSLQPWGAPLKERPREASHWARAFDANDRFADELKKKEAELDWQPPIHLFGCAPLVLMLHLGWRLSRRPLIAYQQRRVDGTWAPGYARSEAPAPEPFFRVEGLPSELRGGRGHVALLVEVTHDMSETALKDLQARHGSELLATVRLRTARTPSHTAVQSPGEVSRAVEEFRGVLDTLHRHVPGAESVLLALACPASFAVALGTAVNPHTQHPLALHHYFPDKGCLPVHLLGRGHQAQRVELSTGHLLEATRVLGEVSAIHQGLLKWLQEPGQEQLRKRMGGEDLLRSQVDSTPANETVPMFRYLGGKWQFHVELLLGLKELRNQLRSEEDWKECVRLILLHECYHPRQRGPTSYDYNGSGRTGWVLEAVDYDADVFSIESALAWRRALQPGIVAEEGTARTLERIIWNVLEGLRVFELERPLAMLPERRLRRYLIWLFHACRLACMRSASEERVSLGERVFIEVAGLPGTPDLNESYPQFRVRIDKPDPQSSLSLAVYHRQQYARWDEGPWVASVLKALSRWEEQGRDRAQEEMRGLFERFFHRYGFFVDRA